MSFRFYKFCQSPIITFLSVIYTFFAVLTVAHGFPWWGSLLLGVVGFFIGLLPYLAAFHPFIFGIYMLLAIGFSVSHITIHFYILIAVFILHVVRCGYILRLCIKDPQLSLKYDTALRYKLKF